MFTGIIENKGIIQKISQAGTNLSFLIQSKLSSELEIDQSLSHNGVCLTIEAIESTSYQVSAVKETLSKTTLGSWRVGKQINLERAMTLNNRIDGHLVQGHVDAVGRVLSKSNLMGSWEFMFQYPESFAPFIIEKGSIAVDGISLTAFDVTRSTFNIAAIPYTYEHTNLQQLEEGDKVNLEFDMIGKYVNRMKSLNPA